MDNLTRKTAEEFLRQFTCVNPSSPQTLDYETVRNAVLVVADQSDYQILGICADNAEQGLRSLHSYSTALGYKNIPDIPIIEGVIYIKFNPKLGSAYIKPYVGEHRGVLVSCQSAYDNDVNELFGHLPLDLFDTK